MNVEHAPAEPSPPEPAGDGLVCGSCGYINPAGAWTCQREAPKKCRRALRGNGLSRRTGLYASLLAPELQAIDDEGAALYQQSVTDAGGRSELGARELTLHENRAVVQTTFRKVARALEVHGLFDRRGRMRVAWVTKLESLAATALALDKVLGLDRRQRAVDFQQTLAAAFHRKAEREGRS